MKTTTDIARARRAARTGETPRPQPPVRTTLLVNPATAAVARRIGALACRSVKGFVFCASTGRSGTHTLQNLLATVPGCVATFEPDPIMHRQVMRDYNRGDDRLMRRVFQLRKLPTIYREAAFRQWYVETNHLFIKSFHEAVVESFGDRVQVIHLERDRHDVAASLFARGSMDGRGGGYQFHLDPAAVRNEIRIAHLLGPGRRFAHNYYACLWESWEIAARVRRFHQKHPAIPIHFVRSEQLSDFAVTSALMRRIGMDVDESALRSRLDVRLGTSEKRPSRPDDVSEADLAEFEDLCRAELARVGPAPPSFRDVAVAPLTEARESFA